MADIGALDDLERRKAIRMKEAEIRRMTNAVAEGNDKIFFLESDILRLKESIKISEKEIASKKLELEKMLGGNSGE